MKSSIIKNINYFFKNHPSFEELYQVVYLMVELRKLLECEETSLQRFMLVKFHADWILHVKKDYIPQVMKDVLNHIEKKINIYLANNDINFLYMTEFRNELIELLKLNQLPSDFCINEKLWFKFIYLYSQCVVDQPIINPTKNIAEFRYIDLKGDGIMVNIDFKEDKKNCSITLGFGYNYKNLM